MTDIPQTEKEFSRWRKKQTFATPELVDQAGFVEQDMKLLAVLDEIKAERPDLTHEQSRASIALYRAAFERDYLASVK